MNRRRGPLLTLLAVAGLALALLNINVSAEPAVPAEQATAAAAAEPPVAPTVEAAPEPPPAPAPVAPAPVAPAPAAPAEAAYAGRTSGNEATIAIAVKDGRAVAYLCDGEEVEAWLEGTVDGATLTLQGADGATATGELRDGAVFGQATAQGEEWPFSAALATAPAGSYRGSVSVAGVQKRIGWNVLPDGSVTGVVRDVNGVAPAPPLDAAARTASLDGIAVAVDPVTGDDAIG